jgi:F420-0:gamma-glutamyl ligase
MRYTGVTARGIKTPIFREGDDLVSAVSKCLLDAAAGEGFAIEDGDIISVTEAVVARTQGNYATLEQIAKDIRRKLGGGTLGVVFPILSRNRFSLLLKAMALASSRLVVQLSYPADEVGNALLSYDQLEEKGVNPYRDSFTLDRFRAVFGANTVHRFTGVDYIKYYKALGDNVEIVFSNDPKYILTYTKDVLVCDIHTRARTQRIIKAAGGERVYRLDEIMTQSVDGSGFNPQYGLLGSNMASEDKVKLFPRDTDKFVSELAARLYGETGKRVEVMVYGDGCFKDPVGGIWEFADPVVAPAFTPGLAGTPNEIKLKYFADSEFTGLSGEALRQALLKKIREKGSDLTGSMHSQGTTPRRITDLIGSLSDLISGSGDRGTPIVHVKGYFTNYATE